MPRHRGDPRVAVVGAGIVGLSTAWFLRQQGVRVTVLERTAVGAGASWGSAGWLMAGDVSPLPSPGALREGLRGLVDPSASVRVSLRPDLARFAALTRFARNSTRGRRERSLQVLLALADRAYDAYDELSGGGVDTARSRPPVHLSLFTSVVERDAYADHLRRLASHGSRTRFELLSADDARRWAPLAGPVVRAGIGLRGQQYVDPTRLLPSLGQSLVDRGATLDVGHDVVDLRDTGSRVELLVRHRGELVVRRFDAVVLCTGAWLGTRLRRFGVGVHVTPGRGYSFSVALPAPLDVPLYLPGQHLACTPMNGRLRVAGTMELQAIEAPPDPRRFCVMAQHGRAVLTGLDLDRREDEWVGARPVSADGLPLAGPTTSPRVWCVGGHAMEGMVLGPATAKLTAEALVTGTSSPLLRALVPTR